MIVLHVAPALRPGGGPAGYCYNLMQGFENGSFKDSGIQFQFHGDVGARTTSATSGRSFQLAARIKMWLEFFGLKDILIKSSAGGGVNRQELLNKISGAEIVAFHGPAPIALLDHAKREGKKIVYMPHSPSISADEHRMILQSNGVRLLNSVYKRRVAEEAAFFSAADLIIFPSPGASEEYRARYDLSEAKVQYIPSGVPDPGIPLPERAPKKPGETIVALFAGRYVDHKGYDVFCEASELLDYDNVKFVTAGAGPLGREYANVTNLGWRPDVHNVILEADFVVVPNRVAYYDLLPLECAALGKPLILTDVGGSRDQAALLPDSLVAQAGSVEDLAKNIQKACTKVRSCSDWGNRNLLSFRENAKTADMISGWINALSPAENVN